MLTFPLRRYNSCAEQKAVDATRNNEAVTIRYMFFLQPVVAANRPESGSRDPDTKVPPLPLPKRPMSRTVHQLSAVGSGRAG